MDEVSFSLGTKMLDKLTNVSALLLSSGCKKLARDYLTINNRPTTTMKNCI